VEEVTEIAREEKGQELDAKPLTMPCVAE